jgi:hypothetical protein
VPSTVLHAAPLYGGPVPRVSKIVLGVRGLPGAAGPGVPTAGTTGQFLRKTSGTNYATSWQPLTGADVAAALAYTPADNAVTISAGTGLTGGGSLAACRRSSRRRGSTPCWC